MINLERLAILLAVILFWGIATPYIVRAGLYTVGETIEQATKWKSTR